MQRLYMLFLLLLLFQNSYAQTTFAGIWEGVLTLKESDSEFEYQLILTQNGTTVKGTSLARIKGGDKVGAFDLVGEIKDGKLYLNDANQISPKDKKWCWKELTLWRSDNQMSSWLGGYWSSENCGSGLIRLQGKDKPAKFVVEKEDVVVGKWTGAMIENGEKNNLEFILHADFSGSSIIKLKNGTQKTHNIRWKRNGKNLVFKEISQKGKENNKWQWCLKEGSFRMRQENRAIILEGTWAGYKGPFTLETGECSGGQIYLTKL